MMNQSNKNYINMLDRSITNIGNTYRIKRAINKARSGKEVTIVYLGASITMLRSANNDRGYATLSYQYFRDRYGLVNNINYINSGMNGTSSIIGLTRVDRDVLNYNPDIVFLEFAVNDSKDNLHREMFESLVLRILKSKTKPAVILLFMTTETGYSCRGHMQAIGEHYDLAMISISDAIFPEIAEGRMTWREYSDDNIHPNLEGNSMIADMISHYFQKLDALPSETEDIRYPEKAFFGDSYVTMEMLDSRNAPVISLGSFKEYCSIKEFSYGWVHQKESGNGSFQMKIKCKSILVIYKESNNQEDGNALIHVDGELRFNISGFRIFGWNNPIIHLLFQEEESRDHIIEISMAPGDENKKFTLLAFGYCR